jgi:hypothetical protein
MRVGGDNKLGGVYTLSFEAVDFFKQDSWVNHNTVTNNWYYIWAQNARREKMQGEFLIADYYGMTSVVATLVANNIVNSTT